MAEFEVNRLVQLALKAHGVGAGVRFGAQKQSLVADVTRRANGLRVVPVEAIDPLERAAVNLKLYVEDLDAGNKPQGNLPEKVTRALEHIRPTPVNLGFGDTVRIEVNVRVVGVYLRIHLVVGDAEYRFCYAQGDERPYQTVPLQKRAA